MMDDVKHCSACGAVEEDGLCTNLNCLRRKLVLKIRQKQAEIEAKAQTETTTETPAEGTNQ